MRIVFPFALACALGLGPWAVAQEQSPPAFFHEFFGRRGYTDPQVEKSFRLGMMNGLTFSPPVEDEVSRVSGAHGAGLMLLLFGAPIGSTLSEAVIEKERLAFDQLAANASGSNFYWNLMAEWDQGGGAWVARGRPRYLGLSRQEADARFWGYYQSSFPSLLRYLAQPPGQRKYQLAAVTDYVPNVYRAYEMGVELQLIQRGIDELGDLSTGVAFQRGAARQYGRNWGVDFSSWRTSINSSTKYSDNGTLLGGWSHGYLRRNYYAAFAAGARTIHNQAASYSYPNGRLNPFGEVTQEFADYALRRHPEAGEPVVPTAILIDHYSGFDPKHGIYNQQNAVWYQDIPYSDGDYMLDNFFHLAFPGHSLHGLTPGAPFANSSGVPDSVGFLSYLASGGDPQLYEPMPSTRWGDNLDVITNQAPAAALDHYKLIVLVGGVQLDSRLRADLRAWVSRGGILVMNASQSTSPDEELLGVALQSTRKSASSSRWLPLAVATAEAPYSYFAVQPTQAEVLAVSESEDPLITRNRIGAGEVYFTTPEYLQSKARDRILRVGSQLLDTLSNRLMPARISGPPIEYIVGEASGKIIVTLINNTASEWAGETVIRRPAGLSAVAEYLSGETIGFRSTRREVTVPVRVPRFDVRVIALEYSPVPGSQSAPVLDQIGGTEP